MPPSASNSENVNYATLAFSRQRAQ